MPRVEFSKSKRRKTGLIVSSLLVLAFGAFISLFPSPTHALNTRGPDGLYFDHGTNNATNKIWYDLSDTLNVTAHSMLIPIYTLKVPTGPIPLTISYQYSYGGVIQLSVGGTTLGNNPTNLMIPVGAKIKPISPTSGTTVWRYNKDSGYYVAFVSARLTSSGNEIPFLFSVPAGFDIGYSNINNSTFAITNTSRCASSFPFPGNPNGDNPSGDLSGCGTATSSAQDPETWGKYYDYQLPFAPPCSLGASKTPVSIIIYDPDNTSGGDRTGTQPAAFGITLIDDTPGGPPTSVAMSSSVVDAAPGTPGADYSSPPSTSDNKATQTLSFSYTPGRKYTLHLDNVYVNNVLQFQLPFDSIYHEVPCAGPAFSNTAVAGTVTPATITAGKAYTVTFNGYVKTTGADNSCILHLTGPPAADYTAGPTPLTDGVAPGCKIGTNGPYTFSYAFNVPTTVVDGSSVCISFGVSPTSNTNAKTNSVPMCVKVSNPKIPLVDVNGDVHSGAAIGDVGCTIPAGVGYIRVNTGSTGSEVVSALGTISQFAANNGVGGPGSPSIETYPVCRTNLVQTAADYLTPPVPKTYTLISPAGCTVDLAGISKLPGAQLLMKSSLCPILKVHGTLTNKLLTIYVPNGDLWIDGNISVKNTAPDIRANQAGLGFIVNKGNTNINGAATSVDAYIYSDGNINTCYPYSLALCSNQLTVNGFIMGHTVQLHRLGAGGGPTIGEQINMNGELYLNPPPIFGLAADFSNYYNGIGEFSPRY